MTKGTTLTTQEVMILITISNLEIFWEYFPFKSTLHVYPTKNQRMASCVGSQQSSSCVEFSIDHATDINSKGTISKPFMLQTSLVLLSASVFHA
jgi:hypothetical protein